MSRGCVCNSGNTTNGFPDLSDKARIRFATLQLAKERGSLAHPCLRNYYTVAQITPLQRWCNDTYVAKWKEITSGISNPRPIQAVMADVPFRRVGEPLGKSHTRSMEVGMEEGD